MTMKEILTPFIFLFIIYPFYLKGLIGDMTKVIFYLFIIIYFIYRRDKIAQLFKIIINNKRYIRFISLGLFVTLLTVIVPALYGTQDYSYCTTVIKYIVMAVVRYVFLLLLFWENFKKEKYYFIKQFNLAIIIMVLSSFILFIPPIRQFWINIIEMPEISVERLMQSWNYTRFSIIGFSSFIPTMFCSLAVIFCGVLLINNEMNENYIIFNVVFCIVGNLLYGRTGMIVSTIILVILLPLLYKTNKSFVIKFITILGVGLVLIICLSFFVDRVRQWVVWAFEFIINYIKYGQIRTASTDLLIDMFDRDFSLRTILVGDGLYTVDGVYYQKVDIGLFRNIYYFGLLGTIPLYIAYLTNLKEFIWTEKNKVALTIIFMVLTIVFELKGEAVFVLIPLLFGLVLSGSLFYSKNIEIDS